MAEIQLQKIKLVKKETLSIGYMQERKGKKPQLHTIEDGEAVHDDLKNAMMGLRIHFAMMCEFVTAKQMGKIESYDSELVKDFHISGITLGGAEDEAFIILTGQRTLTNGKVITINTAHTRVEEDDKTRYRFMKELLERIQVVKDEVQEYMAGKYAPDLQGSLDFSGGGLAVTAGKGVTHAQVAAPAGAKGPQSVEEVAKMVVDEVNGLVAAGTEAKPKGSGSPKKPQTPDNPAGK